jgi:biopolymer transport protein ExbD
MKIRVRRHPHPEIPLVSTADVAFLLLIFFLSTTILNVERGIVLALPGPQERIALPAETHVADVVVGPDGAIRLGDVRVPADRLRGALAVRLATDPALLVRIAVDARAPYAALVTALDQVKLSGARQVSLQTEPGS